MNAQLVLCADDGEVAVQRPEAFDLEGAAEVCGLEEDPGFIEMLGTMKRWEETLAASKKAGKAVS